MYPAQPRASQGGNLLQMAMETCKKGCLTNSWPKSRTRANAKGWQTHYKLQIVTSPINVFHVSPQFHCCFKGVHTGTETKQKDIKYHALKGNCKRKPKRDELAAPRPPLALAPLRCGPCSESKFSMTEGVACDISETLARVSWKKLRVPPDRPNATQPA